MSILEEPIKEIRTIKNYIDGEWVKSQGDILDVVNPVKNEHIAQVAMSSGEELDNEPDFLGIAQGGN